MRIDLQSRVGIAVGKFKGKICRPNLLPKVTLMLALTRLVYGFLRKEELMAFDYLRKHPRVRWIIALDAVLSITLVFSGFAYASQSTKSGMSVELKRIGAVAMSSSEFVKNVRKEGGREYWFGDMTGLDIMAYKGQDGVHSVSYVKRGSNPSDLSRPKITILTYNQLIDETRIQSFGTWLLPTKSVTASGLIVQYDLSSMTDQIVAINGTSNIVSIHYPAVQSLETLMENAVALRLVN